jgi:hypothetical protein
LLSEVELSPTEAGPGVLTSLVTLLTSLLTFTGVLGTARRREGCAMG